tara:strand:- start:933 stop:1112 length:180 start_codon:yes stop_codon:yes gene_type:complete
MNEHAKTQTITLFGRMYMYDQSKVSRIRLTEILTDLNKHEWKDKKDKEYAIGLISRAIL